MTICRKCSRKNKPSKATEENLQLPFGNGNIKPHNWKNSISEVIIKVTGCEDPKQYWEEKAKFRLEDYDSVTQSFDEKKTFTGYFVNINQRTDQGWQGFVWCEEFDSLIFVQHGNDDGSGDIGNNGEKIEFHYPTPRS